MNEKECTDCNELHYDGEFTVTFFIKSRASEELSAWFDKVFRRQHPAGHPDFQLAWEKTEGESDRLEISAYNPMFPTTALIALFEAFRRSDVGLDDKDFTGPKLVS